MDRGRVEAFSDGVMAVAITLLALNLAVAGPGHGALLNQLGQRWPTFAAYLISFFTIGIIWVNHHALFKIVRVVDRTLLFLNLLLLLFVVLIPFATATMSEYLTDSGPDGHLAMAAYALVFEGMSVSFSTLSAWTMRPARAQRALAGKFLWAVWLRFSLGGLAYLVAIGVAFVSAPVALAIIGLVAVYYIFERTSAAGGGPGAGSL